MNMTIDRPYSSPHAAERELIELAKSIEAVQDGRIHIEKINAPFLSKNGCNATGPEFDAGIKHAIEQGWLELHESGTYVRLLPSGQDLLSGSARSVATAAAPAVVRALPPPAIRSIAACPG